MYSLVNFFFNSYFVINNFYGRTKSPMQLVLQIKVMLCASANGCWLNLNFHSNDKPYSFITLLKHLSRLLLENCPYSRVKSLWISICFINIDFPFYGIHHYRILQYIYVLFEMYKSLKIWNMDRRKSFIW